MIRQDGSDIFFLHHLKRGDLPVDVLRKIHALCQQGTALECERCGKVVLLCEGAQLLSSGLPYYILDDKCLCEHCSGIAEKYSLYKKMYVWESNRGPQEAFGFLTSESHIN